MFKNKDVKTTDKQDVVEPKVANPSVHVVDVNMAITKSKDTKNKCLRTKNQSRKSMFVIRKKKKNYSNLL